MVFALSAALIVAMQSDFTRLYQRSSNIFIDEQSRSYLRGAEGLATLALLADYDADAKAEVAQDTLEDIWARDEVPYPLEDGGWLAGEVEDLQGRFNLNSLTEVTQQGAGQPRFTPAQAQFIRLLQAVAEPELSEQQAITITQAVGDWVDGDQQARLDGAEDDYYTGLTPAYRVANRPMASVSELRAVKGMTAELFQALQPFVTVWPQVSGRLNIHTAPAMVLRSVAPQDELVPLSAEEGAALASYRCENGFTDLADFFDHPVLADNKEKLQVQMAGLLTQQSEYFLLRARVEVAGRNQRLYSVLQRQNRQVSVLSRIADGRVSLPQPKREPACEKSL
ncbi:general secretion pathway protein GspK [Pseudohalioglobus lutimaris]|uniref:Type II secretion system protein K n=1 Tax=Pseudohalioglobus lutimaris TaxID=1737061 RepID=A0A2N5X7N9_9GAMM|nr:general secretion pathway protein GspK [Pseudohalioglobus lutimaris]